MSNNIIDGALNYLGNLETVADVQFITGTQVTNITLNANTGLNTTTKGVTVVTPPDGYTRIVYGVFTGGNSAVIATSLNSHWVQNTSGSAVTFSATPWALCVKKN